MAIVRERIADKHRYDDWRKRERLAGLATEEEDARKLGDEIRAVLGRVENRLPDEPADRQCWVDLIALLKDAVTTADQIVGCCRVKSDDVAMEE
jgi:hypothetical protein